MSSRLAKVWCGWCEAKSGYPVWLSQQQRIVAARAPGKPRRRSRPLLYGLSFVAVPRGLDHVVVLCGDGSVKAAKDTQKGGRSGRKEICRRAQRRRKKSCGDGSR